MFMFEKWLTPLCKKHLKLYLFSHKPPTKNKFYFCYQSTKCLAQFAVQFDYTSKHLWCKHYARINSTNVHLHSGPVSVQSWTVNTTAMYKWQLDKINQTQIFSFIRYNFFEVISHFWRHYFIKKLFLPTCQKRQI